MSNQLPPELVNILTKEFDSLKEIVGKSLSSYLLSEILNLIMRIEREIYLQKEEVKDWKNGFFPRKKFSLNGIPLKLLIPRTRNSNFYPSIIPKYSRTLPESYNELIESFLISARSTETLKTTFKRLNLPYTEKEIDKIIEKTYEEFKAFNSRQLLSDWFFISMDAKVIDVGEEVKGENRRIRKATLFTAVGVDTDAHKEFLGSYLYYGNENIDGWKEFLENLSQRGVRRVLLWITDNFSGLSNVIQSFFPNSFHQLCVVHLVRNAKYRLKKEVYKTFKEKMNKIVNADTFEEAKAMFEELLSEISKDHPHFAKKLRKDADKYLTFTKFPKEIRSRIKSTNASENLHKELEKIRLNSGGYFQSEKILWVKWGLFISKLQNFKWQKPEPIIASQMYPLKNMFKKIIEQNQLEEKL